MYKFIIKLPPTLVLKQIGSWHSIKFAVVRTENISRLKQGAIFFFMPVLSHFLIVFRLMQIWSVQKEARDFYQFT